MWGFVQVDLPEFIVFEKKMNMIVPDIGRSVYHFLQYVYIPMRYTMLQHWLFIDA